MNQGYSLGYTPVIRNPRLFHQNTVRSANYPIHQMPYPPLPYSPQPYPYYPVPPRSAVLPPIPFSSYSVPTFSSEPTVSSNGLALILIATLVLVALDFAIVRPHKSRYEFRSPMFDVR